MYNFFKAALTVAGAGAVAGLLLVVIYPALLSSPVVSDLPQSQQFAILAFIAITTFVVSFGLLTMAFRDKGQGQSSSTVIVKGSKVGGDVVGGNKTVNGKK